MYYCFTIEWEPRSHIVRIQRLEFSWVVIGWTAWSGAGKMAWQDCLPHDVSWILELEKELGSSENR